jgi:hypothetical protein
MIVVEIKEDVRPICPHCCAELERLWVRTLGAIFGKRFLYFCPHCRKVLGVSHRKGFWMG